jgi:hypothetical protein
MVIQEALVEAAQEQPDPHVTLTEPVVAEAAMLLLVGEMV